MFERVSRLLLKTSIWHLLIPFSTINCQRNNKKELQVGFVRLSMGTRSATCIIMDFEDISDRNE